MKSFTNYFRDLQKEGPIIKVRITMGSFHPDFSDTSKDYSELIERNALIDTGAKMSIISNHIAEKLRTSPDEKLFLSDSSHYKFLKNIARVRIYLLSSSAKGEW